MGSAVSLRLPEKLKSRLEKLSKRTGRSKTYYMVEAISEKLADLEDLYLAEERTRALKLDAAEPIPRKKWKSGMASIGSPNNVPLPTLCKVSFS